MSPDTPKPAVALLLARGSTDDASRPGLKYKALLPLSGRPMADYVLRALQLSEVERIFIIQAEDEPLEKALTPDVKNVFVICGADRPYISDSLICGAESMLDYYGREEMSRRMVMTVPCDIPLARAEDFNHLIRQSRRQDADVFFTGIRLTRLEKAYPGRRYYALYLKDLDGVYATQNICFASGARLGFESFSDGRRGLAVYDRGGREMLGLVELVEGLRKRRRGLFLWSLTVYQVLLRRLLALGNLPFVLKLVTDLLRNRLTTQEIQRGLLLAMNLKFGLLESDATAFSGDIDSARDIEEIMQPAMQELAVDTELGTANPA